MSLLELRNVVKAYQALRPLRVRSLTVTAGDVISIGGVDQPAAEVLVHLVTGAMLPDEGDIELFGRNTRSVTDSDAWLRSLDGVGIVSGRAVLIEAFTLLQNIAMPFSLEVDPIGAAILPQAVAVAEEAGLDAAAWNRPVGASPADAHMRAHLARALALGPQLLIAEHPSASLPRETVSRFAADLGAIARRRQLALIVVTADDMFAEALGGQRLGLEPATGELKPVGRLQRLRSFLRS
jgi:predicted ABC-type transport system involved in lysophospholipase L1 biosynthesis ATPase subunit